MGKLRSIGVLVVGAAVAVRGFAQTHKVAKAETVVRAVGVYEWTGELAKPNASRLIPVTLYIDKELQDAGVYLARPVPFVLQTGDIYELDEAGVSKGTLELSFARHLQSTNVAEAYDDGWFGYGTYKGLAAPKKPVIRKTQPARTAGIQTADVDPDKPHFSNKAGQVVVPGSDAAKTGTSKPDSAKKDDAPAGAADDPDRPKMTRKKDGAADSASTDSAADSGGTTPAGDPDRPTMKRRSGNDTASTPASAGTADSGTTAPADDPDRPTLKRHTAEDAKKKAKGDSEASVTGTGSLNDDPDRPNLHRGKPTKAMTDADLPKMAGLPADLKQMVAVSDAANRSVHDFARAWEDDAERAAILKKMQVLASAQLAAYGANAVSAAKPVPPANRPNNRMRKPASPVRLGQTPLMEEQLKGYLLSYGDTPTYVYQAHTDGTGADLRYVTIVAQRDAQGEPAMVLHNVTDATHMDRTPRLRLVDAVDVEASNRASLLFEMRGQTSRQFGVYRVLGLQAQQIFSTGTMQ
jgi:hypothetical protein